MAKTKPTSDTYVMIDIAVTPSNDYPYGVTTFYKGKKGQEITCRSLRDCLILGNGIVHGLLVAMVDSRELDHNVCYAPRVLHDLEG